MRKADRKSILQHIRDGTLPASPELLELAKQAAERSQAENKKVSLMTHEERVAYINDWAKRISEAWVEAGEIGVGCSCCDPTVKKCSRG